MSASAEDLARFAEALRKIESAIPDLHAVGASVYTLSIGFGSESWAIDLRDGEVGWRLER